MKNYHELLRALMTVILQYHHAKLGLPKDNEPKSTDILFTMPHAETISALTTRISESQKVDKTRGPLLMYILYAIDQLKYLDDNINFIDAAAVNLITQQLIQLIINLNRLIQMSHSEELTVTYNAKEVKIYGLIANLRRYSQCGSILHETLLSQLGIETHTTDKMIEHLIVHLIELPFLRHEGTRLKQAITTLERQNESLREHNMALKTENVCLKHEANLWSTQPDPKKNIGFIDHQPLPIIRKQNSFLGLPFNFFNTGYSFSEITGFSPSEDKGQKSPFTDHEAC